TGAQSISYAFTAVNGNHAYLGYQQNDGLHLIGYDLAARKQSWATTVKPPGSSVTWVGLLALPDALLIGVSGVGGDLPYAVSGVSSARVIDTASGSVAHTKANIGDPRQATVLAYDGRLYVAADASKYQLLAYDLDSLGGGKVVYAAPDDNHRLKALSPCGTAVCLLDETSSDDKTDQLLAVDPGSA